MIILTKINDLPFALNCDLIETVIENPDTTIRLSDGNVYIVKETMQELVEKIIAYRKNIYSGLLNTQSWDD